MITVGQLSILISLILVLMMLTTMLSTINDVLRGTNGAEGGFLLALRSDHNNSNGCVLPWL
jgi:hypothetical protein